MREAVVREIGELRPTGRTSPTGWKCHYCGRVFEHIYLLEVDRDLHLFCEFCRDCALN